MAKKSEVQKELDLNAKDKDDKKDPVVVLDDNDIEKTEKKEDDAEKRIKELQEQMAKMDSDRKEAVDRAAKLEKDKSEATEKAVKAESRAAVTQKEAINQALTASEDSLVSHRKELKLALESGDSDKAVEMQEKLAEAKYLNSELKKTKTGFEQWEKQQEELAKQPKQPQITPAAQAWINRNPKFTTDPEYAQEAESAYALAVRRGISPDSVECFKFVDSRLKQIFPEKSVIVEEDEEEQPKKKASREASYSAPPSRGSSSDDESTSGSRRQYKLTAAQMEAAEFMKMTPVQYAQFLEAEKERN